MKTQVKLTTVSLAGYKSYGPAVRVDLDDVNVIIGANGVGKSNFISFFEMLAYIASDGLTDFVGKNGYADALCYFGAREDSVISGDFQFATGQSTDEYATGQSTDEYSFEVIPTVAGGLFFSKEKISYFDGHSEKEYTKEFRNGLQSSALIRMEQKGDNSTIKSILHMLRGLRVFHFNDTGAKAGMRTYGYLFDNAYLRSDAGNLAAFLYQMKEKSATNSYYRRIVSMIQLVFPRFADFELRPLEREGTDPQILLNWREKGSEKIFGPFSLSDGTMRFIALVTLLLQPEDTLPDVIILDEPEIGLHPQAVHVLREIIYQVGSRSQIIIATQSPLFLDGFDVSDVLVADYNEQKKSSVINRLNEQELSDWLKDYSLGELWEKNVLGGNP